MKHPFVVGKKYKDRQGEYEVKNLHSDDRMDIQYVDGRNATVEISFQQRIWENIELDEEIENSDKNQPALPPTPGFFDDYKPYQFGSSPSQLLERFEAEEIDRASRFWLQNLAQKDLPTLPPNTTSLKSEEFDFVISSSFKLFQSKQSSGALISCIFMIGFGSIYLPSKVREILYKESMQHLTRLVVQNPNLLSKTMQLATELHKDSDPLAHYLSEELFGLYIRACLLAGEDLFISHFDERNRIIVGNLSTLSLEKMRLMAVHHGWILAMKIPVPALSILVPNYADGEFWLNVENLEQRLAMKSRLSKVDPTSLQRLHGLQKVCWREIRQKRHYDVPSQGRAEILVEDEKSQMLELSHIRFVREGCRAPSIFLRFHFGQNSDLIGLVRVSLNGKVEGFHEQHNGILNERIPVIALTYYRDLVIPDKVFIEYQGGRNASKRKSVHKPRPLPRQYRIDYQYEPVEISEWYFAQHRALHPVVGHIRWQGPRFIADEEKKASALAAGVRLPPGYTWVTEHERGGRQSRLQLKGTDLTRRTLFWAPARAVNDLKRLFA